MCPLKMICRKILSNKKMSRVNINELFNSDAPGMLKFRQLFPTTYVTEEKLGKIVYVIIPISPEEFDNIMTKNFPPNFWNIFDHDDTFKIDSRSPTFQKIDNFLKTNHDRFIPQEVDFNPSDLSHIISKIELAISYPIINMTNSFLYLPDAVYSLLIYKFAPKELMIIKDSIGIYVPFKYLYKFYSWIENVFPEHLEPELSVFRLHFYFASRGLCRINYTGEIIFNELIGDIGADSFL